MKTLACLIAFALAALLSAAAVAPCQEAPAVVADDDSPFSAHGIDELVAQAAADDKAWLTFLDKPSMLAGVYRLPAGGQDGQKPHDLDEVYYVVSGRATFEAAGERQPARPGDVLFVAAEVDHRFLDIEEDLVLLVVFPKGPVAAEPEGASDR